MQTQKRCPWVPEDDPLYVAYHDTEWGVPIHDDRVLFEFLILEAFQAGLSWRTVLHKRKNFRKAFANFNPVRVSQFKSREVGKLLKDAGIIRNRQKINAAIENAKQFLAVKKEFGTFARYQWSFVQGKPIQHKLKKLSDYPAIIPEAEVMARDMKKRGFKFLGPTVLYAHMQAVGMVNDHTVGCFRHKKLPKRA